MQLALNFANVLTLISIILLLDFEIKLRGLKKFPYILILGLGIYAIARFLFAFCIFEFTKALIYAGILMIFGLIFIAINFRAGKNAVLPILLNLVSSDIPTLIHGIHFSLLTWILFGVKKDIRIKFARDLIVLSAYVFSVFHIAFVIDPSHLEYLILILITGSVAMLYSALIVNSYLRWWI